MLALKYFVHYFILILFNFVCYNFINWIQTINLCYFMLRTWFSLISSYASWFIIKKKFCNGHFVIKMPQNKWILMELRNCISCIIRVWSVFYSLRVYISLHFLHILLVKLSFCPLHVYIFSFGFQFCSTFWNSVSS